jgi:hypothetical protein
VQRFERGWVILVIQKLAHRGIGSQDVPKLQRSVNLLASEKLFQHDEPIPVERFFDHGAMCA